MPESDSVPIVYYQCVKKLITVRDAQYVFMIRYNIALSYVASEHVESILSIKGGCCGGQKAGVFRLATDQEIRIWNGEADR